MAGLHRAPLGLNLWGTQRPGTSRLEGGQRGHRAPLTPSPYGLGGNLRSHSRSRLTPEPGADHFRSCSCSGPSLTPSGTAFSGSLASASLPSYQEGTGRRGTHTSPWVSLDAVTSRRFGQKKVKIHTFCGPCEF